MSDLPSSLTPLGGGWSGQTFLGEVAGERVVVRIYPPDDPRGPAAPEVDAAVVHLVRGLVPVPEVVEVRRGDGEAPGLLLTRWLPATPGDRALPDLDVEGRARMGASMGRIAATLAGMPTRHAGLFRDSSLHPEPFAADLVEWVSQHEPRLLGWDAGAIEGLRDLADRAQDLLEQVDRTCLVHSDLNPKNVLVREGPEAGGEVVAVLDWEFAHSGHPLTDLGNVLRFESETEPAYADAALASYVAVRGGTQHEARDLARAADLWALVDLAARDTRNPVADRAEALLRTLAQSGDLHAWPAGW